MYGPGDVRVEERDEPRLVESTDAIIRVSAACVCGSDLWPYRGVEDLRWPAPMRRFLPELIDLIWSRQIDPGKVFDLELPLDEAPDGYRAMDQREAIKVLLRP
jgi:threonine dehydrogenase-like Zn-dependent dehydrogenase